MKNLFILLLCSIAATSCYNTKVLVGDVTPTEPLTKVNKEWNHNLIVGLVPLGNTKLQAKDFVNDAPNYVIKTNISLLNYVLYPYERFEKKLF